MNKIINILLLGLVGVLGGLFALLIWMIGFILLIFNEIVGTKNFRTKLHKLNVIVKEEFGDIFNVFHKLDKVQ